MPADDTGRRLIRQAQREGRLGTLSPRATELLSARATVLQGARVSVFEDCLTYCKGRASGESLLLGDVAPETARELGVFLAQLAEWMS